MKVVQPHERMLQSCRIFPSVWTGEVPYCRSRRHGCRDLSAAARTHCLLLPLLLLPGCESTPQTVCPTRLSISSGLGDGGRLALVSGGTVENMRKKTTESFLRMLCCCVTARYTAWSRIELIWMCEGQNSSAYAKFCSGAQFDDSKKNVKVLVLCREFLDSSS